MSTERFDDVSDAALWAEVLRRELASVVGYVSPEQMSREDPYDESSLFVGHVLFDRNWTHRLPVFGLRDGETIR